MGKANRNKRRRKTVMSHRAEESRDLSSKPGGVAASDLQQIIQDMAEQFKQFKQELADASADDRARLAEYLRQAASEQDVQHVVDRIEKDPQLRHVGRRMRDFGRKHPPGWIAWFLSVVIPVAAPTSGLFGQSPSAPAPSDQPGMSVPEFNYQLSGMFVPGFNYQPPPDFAWERSIIDQLSPEILEGFTPEEQIIIVCTAVNERR